MANLHKILENKQPNIIITVEDILAKCKHTLLASTFEVERRMSLPDTLYVESDNSSKRSTKQ